MWIQAPEERNRRALNRETKDEGPSTGNTTSVTSVTGKDLEKNSMKDDSTESISTTSSFESTPQALVLEGPAMLSESQAPPQLSTLNPGSAVAIPPIQQPPPSLPLPFGADVQTVQSVPGPPPLSTLNPGSAVAIPPFQQPLPSFPLPFGADVQSVQSVPGPPQLSSLNPGGAVAISPSSSHHLACHLACPCCLGLTSSQFSSRL
jgi:hypothetical protein